VPTPQADADRDGFASVACGGTDCDDMDFRRNPGLTEECDAAGFDSNCNPGDEPTITTWYADCDGDGYAAVGAVSTMTCARPTGGPTTCPSGGSWTARVPDPRDVRTADCHDGDARVRPDASFYGDTYTTTEGTSSYDYNCDGVISPEYGESAEPRKVSCGVGGCGTPPPPPLFPQRVACGAMATLYSCEDGVLPLTCSRVASSRPVTKRCR
jgi:hypothetical protein